MGDLAATILASAILFLSAVVLYCFERWYRLRVSEYEVARNVPVSVAAPPPVPKSPSVFVPTADHAVKIQNKADRDTMVRRGRTATNA